jgi:hypothetical protein
MPVYDHKFCFICKYIFILLLNPSVSNKEREKEREREIWLNILISITCIQFSIHE